MTAPITEITGGVGGMTATYQAVRALAARFDAAGDRLRCWAGSGLRVLADGDLLASATLSPLTFAEAEETVTMAMLGAHGLLASSFAFEADARLVRASVAAVEVCDELVATSFDVLDYAAGRALGTALTQVTPEALAVGAVAAGAVAVTWNRLPADTRARLAGEAGEERDLVEGWVVTHPDEVQHAVNGSGGLVDGLLSALPVGVPAALGLSSFHPTPRAVAADLAGLYGPESPPRVRRRPELAVPLGSVPPADLVGLMRHLDETNDLSAPARPDDQGTIEVQTLTGRDGTVRHVVYLPGADDVVTSPFDQDGDVRDLATSLHLVAGHDTTYVAGIGQAMARAGVGPDEPVLLVGHSQGGLAAARLLADGSPYQITHVVTAGAPTAGVGEFPTGSHVLSLEHRGDLVPLLDGHDNPDSREQVTVGFDDHEQSVTGNHRLSHYVEGARAIEASDDASIREQVAALREAGFLGSGTTATSQVFQITR